MSIKLSRRNLIVAGASMVPIALSAKASFERSSEAATAGSPALKGSSSTCAYWLGRSTFRDVKLINRYLKENKVFSNYPKGNYSYELLSRDGKAVVLEGASHYEHYYLWKFPSVDVALERYNYPQYQEAANLRRAGSSASELVVMEGGDHFSGKY